MIPIRNIYYMLAYVFKLDGFNEYNYCNVEKFTNAFELLSELLIIATRHIISDGLESGYTSEIHVTSSPRGKLLVSKSCSGALYASKKLACNLSSFSKDTYNNRVIKSVLVKIKHKLKPKHVSQLHHLLSFFSEVRTISSESINWNLCKYSRRRSYKIALNICKFINNSLIPNQELGASIFSNDIARIQNCKLFEKFVLAYYKKHHDNLLPKAPIITWALLNEYEKINMLPQMRTDLVLTHERKALIVDTKFYKHNTNSRYNKDTIRSDHLYQLYAYIDNYRRKTKLSTSGMLLYAKTDKDKLPDCDIKTEIGKISIRTLDLNQKFENIAKRLDGIASDFTTIR